MRRYLSWILSICVFVFAPQTVESIVQYNTMWVGLFYLIGYFVVILTLFIVVFSDIMEHYRFY